MADFNPYQAPIAHVEDIHDTENIELAERGTRLGAVIIDALIFLVPGLLAFVPIMLFSRQGSAESIGVGAMIAVSVGILGILAILVIDFVMLHRKPLASAL